MTDAEQTPAETPAAEDKKEANSRTRTPSPKSNAIWMGTAVGIGSAALVAALMYAKRRK
jgi:hypothetical protein